MAKRKRGRRQGEGDAPGVGVEALFAMLQRNGHLRPDHVPIADNLVRDLRRYEGESYGVVNLGGAGGGSNPADCDLPYVKRIDSDALLRHLRQHEREALSFAILFKDRGAHRFTLAQFGRRLSTYEDTATACAYAVGRILATLESYGELLASLRPRPG